MNLPIEVVGARNFIERAYREGQRYQWAREFLKNSLEAEATRVEFGIEWQAVAATKTYRRTISDNGCGMDADEFLTFFRAYGGGGKPIGDADENFGIGSKSSSMPWNPYGIVIVSRKDGIDSMIWLQRENGEYGLREFPSDDGPLAVYEPFDDDESGIDWRKVMPDWIGDNGTTVVLMGTHAKDDTVVGDPGKEEEGIGNALVKYLNERFWEFPQDVDVRVYALTYLDKAKWPKVVNENIQGEGAGKRWRPVTGAKSFIPDAKYVKHGEVDLKGGATALWFLADEERLPQLRKSTSLGRSSGFISYLYDHELYTSKPGESIGFHHSTYRMYGITPRDVKDRLWIVIRPKAMTAADNKLNPGEILVYPAQARSVLHATPVALPVEDWATEFARDMPEEIQEALRSAFAHDTESDDHDTLGARFAAKLEVLKLAAATAGRLMFPTSTGAGSTRRGPKGKVKKPRKPRKATDTGTRVEGDTPIGDERNTGTQFGKPRKTGVTLPHGRAVTELEGDGKFAAVYTPPTPAFPGGVVEVLVSHPVIQATVSKWVEQYPGLEEEVTNEVIRVGFIDPLRCAIAHSEWAKKFVGESVSEMRTPEALTMYCMGIIGQDALIGPALGKYGRRRKNAA